MIRKIFGIKKPSESLPKYDNEVERIADRINQDAIDFAYNNSWNAMQNETERRMKEAHKTDIELLNGEIDRKNDEINELKFKISGYLNEFTKLKLDKHKNMNEITALKLENEKLKEQIRVNKKPTETDMRLLEDFRSYTPNRKPLKTYIDEHGLYSDELKLSSAETILSLQLPYVQRILNRLYENVGNEDYCKGYINGVHDFINKEKLK